MRECALKIYVMTENERRPIGAVHVEISTLLNEDKSIHTRFQDLKVINSEKEEIGTLEMTISSLDWVEEPTTGETLS